MKHFDKATADPVLILVDAIRGQLPEGVNLKASADDLLALCRRIEGHEQTILLARRPDLFAAVSDTLLTGDYQTEIYDLASLIEHGAWSLFLERLSELHHGLY